MKVVWQQNKSLVVTTGKNRSITDGSFHCGRAQHIGFDSLGANQSPIQCRKKFDALWERVEAYLADKECFVSHVHVGADSDHYLARKMTTKPLGKTCSVVICLSDPKLTIPSDKQEWQILNVANFVCDPERDGTNSDNAVIINFTKRKVLLAGNALCGRNEKAMFSVQNFLLPEKDVLPSIALRTWVKTGKPVCSFGFIRYRKDDTFRRRVPVLDRRR